MRPITVSEFLREVGLPPQFRRLKRFYDQESSHTHCNAAQFDNSSRTYLRSVYVPHDRTSHVPSSGTEFVVRFKEYLYRYLVHPSLSKYKWTLNVHFIRCPLRNRCTIRLVFNPKPVRTTDTGEWRTTACEIHYILNSNVPFTIYALDRSHSLQYIIVPQRA